MVVYKNKGPEIKDVAFRTMEGSKILWTLFTLLSLTFVVNGKRSGDRDEDNGLISRPTRNKANNPDRKQELFAGLPEPESSAQQVSPAVSGYQGNLGGQNGLLGNQGLYPGIQGQGINPGLGLGQGQLGFNPYLGGFGTTNLGGGTFGGVGTAGFQNPYPFVGGSGQDIYSQQSGLGGSGFGGFYNPQQGGLGFSSGFYNTNPYLAQGQTPYVVNPYLQQGTGGISTQYLNSNVNPYSLTQRNPGYIQNPYLGTGIGSGTFGGFINPYGLNNFNPYNSFPLTSRFGLGAGRGSLGSRSNNGGGSSSSSSSDE